MVKLFIIIWTGLFSLSLAAQDRFPVVEEIVVLGNSRMSIATVKRVMALREGERASPDRIKKARERLEGLGVFSHISLEEKTGQRGLLLIVSLKEKSLFFITPQINLGGSTEFNFGEEDEKTYYGLETGLRDFSGKNHHLVLEGSFGDLTKIGLRYEKKYYSGVLWGWRVQDLWYDSKIYETDIAKTLGSVFFGRRLAKWETMFWARYDHIQFGGTPSSLPDEELLKAGLSLTHDARDWDVFPVKGFLARVGAYRVWERGGGPLYNRYIVECSFFHNLLADHIVALDAVATFSRGTVPLYDRLYFGGQRTLRGVPIGRYAGANSVVVSCEYRVPLSRFQKGRPEAVPQGTAFYFFLDAGSIADTVSELHRKELILNAGAGLFWIITSEAGLKLDLSVQPDFRLTVSSLWKF